MKAIVWTFLVIHVAGAVCRLGLLAASDYPRARGPVSAGDDVIGVVIAIGMSAWAICVLF